MLDLACDRFCSVYILFLLVLILHTQVSNPIVLGGGLTYVSKIESRIIKPRPCGKHITMSIDGFMC